MQTNSSNSNVIILNPNGTIPEQTVEIWAAGSVYLDFTDEGKGDFALMKMRSGAGCDGAYLRLRELVMVGSVMAEVEARGEALAKQWEIIKGRLGNLPPYNHITMTDTVYVPGSAVRVAFREGARYAVEKSSGDWPWWVEDDEGVRWTVGSLNEVSELVDAVNIEKLGYSLDACCRLLLLLYLKIPAITLARACLGCGLKEAKDYVEAL
jgi:hypothetical protein